MNRKNLKLLADYLMALPEGYTHFDMSTFNNDDVETINSSNHCGTAACALGHAPYVKGLPKIRNKGHLPFPDYTEYSDRVFDVYHDDSAWGWMFSHYWDSVDNTPQGAAKRIYWLLEHGLPNDWEDQLYDDAELCYQ